MRIENLLDVKGMLYLRSTPAESVASSLILVKNPSTNLVVTRTPAEILSDIGAVPTSRTLTITGTTNQITVSLTGAQSLAANRAWTLSLPQNIHTAATPTFGSLTITNHVAIGTTINADHRLTLGGGVYGDYYQLNPAYSNGNILGRISWDQDNATAQIGLNPNVTLRVGQDDMWYVKNQSGATIPKGSVVYAAGTVGASGRIIIAPYIADGTIAGRFILGITAEVIANGNDGYVIAKGKLRGFNTSSFAPGTVLWASPTTAGAFTATEPSAPNIKAEIAFVIHQHTNNGVLAVRRSSGTKLSDDSEVKITSPATGQLLRYNSNRWENWSPNFLTAESDTLQTVTSRGSSTTTGATFGGNVGIGTTSPLAPLHISSKNGSTDTNLQRWDYFGSSSYQLILKQTVTSGVVRWNFSQINNNTAFDDVLVLDRGNVGIGTTSPTAKLDVSAGTNLNLGIQQLVLDNFSNDGVGITFSRTSSDSDLMALGVVDSDKLGLFSRSGIIFATGGTSLYSATSEQMRITEAGNVGIGTTSPSRKLHVVGDSAISNNNSLLLLDTAGNSGFQIRNTSSNIALIYQSNNGQLRYRAGFSSNSNNAHVFSVGADTEIVRFNNDGNVGIGTTSPGYRFVVNHITTDPIAYFGAPPVNSSSRNSLIILQSATIPQSGSDATGEAGFIFNHSFGTGGVNGTANGGFIKSIRELAFATTAQVNTTLVFGTSISNVDNERMRITSAGNVGIGTTAPTAKLEVNGNIKLSSTAGSTATPSNIWLGNDYSNGTTRDKLKVYLYNSGTEQYGFSVGPASDVQYHSNILHDFYVANSLKVRINGSGNVGIGTTSPVAALQIGNGTSNSSNRSSVAILSADGGNTVLNALSLVNSRTAANGNGTAINFHNASNYSPTSRIVSIQDSGTNASLRFSVYNSTDDALVERITLLSSGNVGIGTTTPFVKFTINNGVVRTSTSKTYSSFIHTNDSDDFRDGLATAIKGGATSTDRYISLEGASYQVSTGIFTNQINLSLNPDGGNVGIGTTSPDSNLHVESSASTYIKVERTGVGYITLGATGGENRIYSRDSSNAGRDLVFEIGTNQRMRITSAGDVGIGTTSPNAKLHVVGNGLFTGTLEVDTVNNGVGDFLTRTSGGIITRRTAAEVLSDIGAQAVLTNPVTGTGTTGQVSFWNGTNTQTGDNGLYWDDTNKRLGIGVTAPPVTLSVQGISYFADDIYLRDGSTTTGDFLVRIYDSSDDGIIDVYRNNSVVNRIHGNGNSFFNAGNVGIGTTSPTEKLHINGRARITTIDNGTGDFATISGTGVITRRTAAQVLSDIGAQAVLTNPITGTGSSGQVSFWTGTTTQSGDNGLFWDNSNKRLGIGTTSPASILHLQSAAPVLTLRATSSSTNSRSTYIHWNSSTGSQTGFVGFGSSSNDDFSIANDVSTGNMRFRTNTSDRMTITSAGNVGIGTASPNATLHISGTSAEQLYIQRTSLAPGTYRLGLAISSNTFVIRDVAQSSDRLIINASGNVGIGTTSPSTKLHIANLTLDNSAYQHLEYITANNSTEASGQSYSGQASYGIGFRRQWNSSTFTNLAGIYAFGSVGWRGGLLFRTKNNTTPTGEPDIDALLLSPSGNVGIGTTSPDTKLDVNGVITATGGNSTNWNTAFGWGNHASAGYGLSTADITAVGLTASTLTLTRALGNLTASVPTWNQNTTGSAATLTTARTIGLSGAATGTATSFNGSANITIPVTALNASNLAAGTVPNERISGIYDGITLKMNNANSLFSTALGNTLARYGSHIVSYRSSSSGQVGAIVFTAPVVNAIVMHSVRIHGMLYSDGGIIDSIVQFYNNNTSSMPNSRIIHRGNIKPQIRVGRNNSGANVIILGDIGSVWSYPHISMSELLASHGATGDAYMQGWTATAVTDLTGYTPVSTPSISGVADDLYAPLARTITAGDGLSGGGDLTANRTISVDSTVVRTSGDQTIGGNKTITGAQTDIQNVVRWLVSGSNSANQRTDARTEATSFARMHWYGMTTGGATSNFRHAWYDGSNYINVTANAGGRIDFEGAAASMYIGSDRVYDDGYHPVADAWTTSRTLTIGDTGKAVNGAGNVSWSLTEIGAFSDQYLINRSITNANSAQSRGVTAFYLTGGASNKPTGTDHALFTLSYSSIWSTQMASDWRTNGWFVRTQNNSTWGSWQRLWHSGDFDIANYYLASNPAGYTNNVGTVTSVGLAAPTGFSVSGSPVTGTGTLTLGFAAGYQGYTTAEATKLGGIAANANNYSLPVATATVLGGIELFSNTVQSVAANAVTTTASRTYGIQLNSAGQAVVNVPWSNTTYSLISTAEAYNTASTTARLISGERLHQWADNRGLTTAAITNWNTAFGWGDHAGLYVESINIAKGDYDSGTDHVMILAPANSVANVNGTIYMERTTGHKGITQIDVLYSTGSTATNRDAALFVKQADYHAGDFSIEIMTINSVQYVVLRRQGVRYFMSTGRFAGFTSYTNTLFGTWYAYTGSSSEIPLTGGGWIKRQPIVLNNDSRLTDARTPTSHTHAISEVTGLQTALDNKASNNIGTSGVLGKTTLGAGAVGTILTSADNQLLRRVSGVLGFGTIGNAFITDLAWSKITATPTTLAGYGITDAYTQTQLDNFFAGDVSIVGYNKLDWDVAFGWGNHSGLYVGLAGNQTVGGIKTFSSKVLLSVSGSSASINIPRNGTSNPTGTVPGDLWYRSNNLYYNNEGTIRAIAHTGSWSAMSVAEGHTATATTSRFMRSDRLKQIIDYHARRSISLTTTGSSGASTYNNSTGALNVPNYTLAGLGGVPTGRTINIIGSEEGAQTLGANRTWFIDKVMRRRGVNNFTDFNSAQVDGAFTVWDGNWFGAGVTRTNFPFNATTGSSGFGVLLSNSTVSSSSDGLMQMYFRNDSTSSVYVRTGFNGGYNGWGRLWSSLDFNISDYPKTSRSINTQHSLTGGGNLSADRTLNLVGDVASPGSNRVYGTNASGTRGWQIRPVETPTDMVTMSLISSGSYTYTTGTYIIPFNNVSVNDGSREDGGKVSVNEGEDWIFTARVTLSITATTLSAFTLQIAGLDEDLVLIEPFANALYQGVVTSPVATVSASCTVRIPSDVTLVAVRLLDNGSNQSRTITPARQFTGFEARRIK